MGTGWSQDEASQSQQQSPGEPSYTAVVEIKVTPKKSRPKEIQGTEKTTVAQVKQQQLPHNYEAIVKIAGSPINKSSIGTPVWTPLCWNTLEPKEEGISQSLGLKTIVTGSGLPLKKQVMSSSMWLNCWMYVGLTYVKGKFDAVKLSPGTLYEVVFVVMLKAEGGGWEIPVNVRLSLPDGNKQERKANLMEKARGQWIEIPVGEFRASQGKLGDIKFSMYEHGGHWKNGLVIKGVAIRPKN